MEEASASSDALPAPSSADRPLAVAAFLAVAASLFSPWYRVRNIGPAGDVYEQVSASPFHPAGVATAWAVHVVGGLLVLVVIWSFVRIAAHSEVHEPRLWRRDLGLVAVLLAAGALAAALLWPGPFDAWWATLRFETGDHESVVKVLPGIGWWLAWVAAGLLAVAWRLAPASNDK